MKPSTSTVTSPDSTLSLAEWLAAHYPSVPEEPVRRTDPRFAADLELPYASHLRYPDPPRDLSWAATPQHRPDATDTAFVRGLQLPPGWDLPEGGLEPALRPLTTHLLVACVEPFQRRLIEFLLRESGHELTLVASAAECLQCLEADPGHFDAVLLCTAALPDMDTLELGGRIHCHSGPLVPVAILTACTPPAYVDRALRADLPVLPKPFLLPELMTLIDAMLLRGAQLRARSRIRSAPRAWSPFWP